MYAGDLPSKRASLPVVDRVGAWQRHRGASSDPAPSPTPGSPSPTSGRSSRGSARAWPSSPAQSPSRASAINLDETVRGVLAVLLILLGATVAVGAGVRWLRVEQAMRQGRPLPFPSLIPFLVLATVLASVVLLLLVQR